MKSAFQELFKSFSRAFQEKFRGLTQESKDFAIKKFDLIERIKNYGKKSK